MVTKELPKANEGPVAHKSTSHAHFKQVFMLLHPFPKSLVDLFYCCLLNAFGFLISSGVFSKEGTLTLKLVNVRAIDTHFSDIAKTFNKQHSDHSAMMRAAQKLKEVSGCAPTASLTACIEMMQQEHGKQTKSKD